MKNSTHYVLVILIFVCCEQTIFAQDSIKREDFAYSNKFSVLAGLIQPMVLRGGNAEITYFSKWMSFDYSHGFSLNMSASSGTLVGDAKEQQLAYYLPFSTGFGIGYRFTTNFDVRVEPKWHKWEVYYDGEPQNESTLIESYLTFTLGLGAYYRYMPFKKKDNWTQGITTSTSIRWWPNVSSSLTDDEFSYHNKVTDNDETLKASNIGIAGTPFLFNISIGYTFGGK